MAIGKSFAHRCPDQSGYEAARKKYVEDALAPFAKPPMLDTKPKEKPGQSAFDKRRADEARRIAGGFVRGGHR